MHENPFEPPRTVELKPAENVHRSRARFAFRATLLLMMVPALYNYLEFDAHILMGSGIPSLSAMVMRITNLVGILLAALSIWFAGFPLLEKLSSAVHLVFANHTRLEAWQAQLYMAIYRGAILAIPGAILWLVWVFGFYSMRINFFVISWAVGAPAHALAACVYGPLLVNWFRIARRKG